MDAIEKLISEHRNYSDMMVEFKRRCDHLKQGDYGGMISMKKDLYSLKLEMELHFAKEEYALFQNVEHPVIQSLMEEHTEMRSKFGDLDFYVVGLQSKGVKSEEGQLENVRLMMDHFLLLMGMHVSNEENILFPYLRQNLSQDKFDFVQEKIREFDNIATKSLLGAAPKG